MEKKEVEKAFKSAEKDLKEEKIKRFKEAVRYTLEKLEVKKKESQVISKEIQILKSDINDLKAGRLDKIADRQSKDVEAEEISVMRIKEVIKEYPIPYYPDYPMTPWQRPWDIVWTSDSSAGTGNDVGVSADSNSYIQINASEAKYNTPGTYVLSNGTIKNI